MIKLTFVFVHTLVALTSTLTSALFYFADEDNLEDCRCAEEKSSCDSENEAGVICTSKYTKRTNSMVLQLTDIILQFI